MLFSTRHNITMGSDIHYNYIKQHPHIHVLRFFFLYLFVLFVCDAFSTLMGLFF